MHTLQREREERGVFKENTKGKNIKEVLTDTNPQKKKKFSSLLCGRWLGEDRGEMKTRKQGCDRGVN